MKKHYVDTIEKDGFNMHLYFFFDEDFNFRDVFPDLQLTFEAIDDSSIKVNRPVFNDRQLWATPNKENQDYFLSMVDTLRDYLDEKINAFVLTVEASKKGYMLGSATVHGCLFDKFPCALVFEEYGLIEDALNDAKKALEILKSA